MKPSLLHGHTRNGLKTPTYSSWQKMWWRCSNPKADRYYLYGAKGIRVCERWKDFASFLSDMGERPAGLTIERIDNKGNYDPSNCKWATQKEQTRNRSQNRWLSYEGKIMCLVDWAATLGITHRSLQKRLEKWPLDKALTLTPRKGVPLAVRLSATQPIVLEAK